MTCDRAYTDTAIRALQEAESRRQHRAELADELRQWVAVQRNYYKNGWVVEWLNEFEAVIDDLSPPVVCDSE